MGKTKTKMASWAVSWAQDVLVWIIAALHEMWECRKRLSVAARWLVITAAALLILSVVALRAEKPKAAPERQEPVGMVKAELPQPEIAAAVVSMDDVVDTQEREEDPATVPLDSEAEYMARVLYGTARFHSPEAQKAVCWCIINRVESSIYPNTIEEVCAQDSQWMGYYEDNPIVQDFYDAACAVLDAWRNNGVRMVPQDYLYLSWSEEEIILRTSFTETDSTHYWRVAG